MQSLLSALFAPEVLGLVLLAGVGLFVFLLVRPREQDPADPYWLAFMNPSPGDDHLRGAGESKPHRRWSGGRVIRHPGGGKRRACEME